MKQANIHFVMRSRCCSSFHPLNKDEALNKDAFRATNISSTYSAAPILSPRRVVMRGIKSFFFRTISRIKTLRDDEAGVRAFTLVELLVVVLIIGVLSAIAIPMYQGAVDKSHWSTMLPGAKAIKDAEEAIRMSNGLYTSNMENLDVRMPDGDVQYTVETINDDGTANVVRATNTKLPTVRLASYLDENTIRAGHLYCESNDGENGRGTRLCSKLLNGEELGTTDDGYTQYLLDQAIDKATCDGVSRVWSNKQTQCYKTEEDRCKANGMPYKDGFCGYKNRNDVTIEEGGTCQANYTSGGVITCNHITVKEGGTCEANIGWTGACGNSDFKPGSACVVTATRGGYGGCNESRFDNATCTSKKDQGGCTDGEYRNQSICIGNDGESCKNSDFYNSTCISNAGYACNGSIFYNGGKCETKYNASGCNGTTFHAGAVCEVNQSSWYYVCNGTFNDGAKCIANAPAANPAFQNCKGTYNGSACCEGKFCPDDAPKC